MMEEKTVHTEEKKTTKERKKETNKNGQNFAPLVQKKKGKKKSRQMAELFLSFCTLTNTHTHRESSLERKDEREHY